MFVRARENRGIVETRYSRVGRERERKRERETTFLRGSSTGVHLNDTPMRRWRLLLTSVYTEEEVLWGLA